MKIVKALLFTLRDTVLSILGLAIIIGIFVGILELFIYILSLLGIVGKYISCGLVIMMLVYGIYKIIVQPTCESFKKYYKKLKEED